MIKEIILAILIMPDGVQISVPMPDESACVEFTRSVAPYVESADCYTMEEFDGRYYILPQD